MNPLSVEVYHQPHSPDTIRQAKLHRPPQLTDGKLIPIRLSVEKTLTFDLDIFLYRERVYLPIKSLFSLLHIKNQDHQDKLVIYFPDPKEPVRIDLNQLIYDVPNTADFPPPNTVFRYSGEVYIRADLLESYFDLTAEFSYRKLTIFLSSTHELPVQSMLKRKERYKNFVAPTTAITPEVTLPFQQHLVNGWIADWAINSSHSKVAHTSSIQLGFGGQLLGGDLSIFGNGSTQDGFQPEQLRGKWRLPINSSSVVKQIQVGDLSNSNRIGQSADFSSFRGISITNRPYTLRRHFSMYHYEGLLDNGRDVELYLNNRLNAFAQGEQKSRYRFPTPLEYGSNLIQLKYFDSGGGASHQKRHIVHIPQYFLPPGEMEYELSAGTSNFPAGQDFSQIDLKWGISPSFTLGGGSTLISNTTNWQLLPFIHSGIRLGSRILVSGSHLYSQRTEGSLVSSFWSTRSLALSIQKYHNKPLFRQTGKTFEATLNTSFPLHQSPVSFTPFIRTRHIRYRSGNQSTHIYSGFRTQLPQNIQWRMNSRMMLISHSGSSYRNSQLELETQFSRRIFRSLLLRPGLTYGYQYKKITHYQLQLTKRISSEYHLEFGYHRDNLLASNRLLLNFRINFPFVQHHSTVRSGAGFPMLHQYMSGSIRLHDWQEVSFHNQRRNGRAGLILQPFLDLNENDQQDPDEPSIKDITGDLYRQGQDRPYSKGRQLFDNLTPYESYIITIREATLNNPLWIPRHSSYSIQVAPNVLTKVPVPILVSGEVSGQIRPANDYSVPLYGIDIDLLSADGQIFKTITTYRGGKFYYVGLKPGDYQAAIHRKQLEARHLTVESDTLPFTIKMSKEGDIVEDLTFNIIPKDQVMK